MADNISIIESINKRYNGLSESSCSLSCGKSLDHLKVRKGSVCADLGCGRGEDVVKLSRLTGEEGFVYGIDVSEGMVTRAENCIRESSVSNAEIIKCPLENIMLKDESVHLVISNCSINHAENKDRVWLEIFRILKNGGEFVVNDIYATGTVPEKYSSDPEAVAGCWGGAVTREMYIQTVKSAGFKEISIARESSPYTRGEVELVSFTISGRKPL